MSQTVTMRYYTCWVCGTPFSCAQALANGIKRDSTTLYCPRGCKLGLGESDEEILRRQLATQEAATQRANARLQAERRSHSSTKGALTKVKRRVSSGVCPCCQRSFKQLRRHMKTKHPDYAEGTDA